MRHQHFAGAKQRARFVERDHPAGAIGGFDNAAARRRHKGRDFE
jgi:hypothetical protein